MKFSTALFTTALAASGAHAAAIDMRASNSWAGSNLYFLHGLSDSDQDNYINTLASYGAKVMRLWVTGISQGCQKGSNVAENIDDLEPSSIGSYNDQVLGAIDKVLAKLVKKGIKAIISPHDGNAFGYNSCDVYCKQFNANSSDQTNAGANYYSNPRAIAGIDARYRHVLNYKSPSSGQAWGQWSDAILAFDLENEPFQQANDLASQNDPSNWLCGRAEAMKRELGDSDVQIATGGIGGDQSHGFNFLDKAVSCDAIDIMSVHGYVSTANFWTGFLPDLVQKSQQNDKLVMVEEWGVTTDYQDGFDAQAAAIDKTGVPWTYWQFTDYDETDCSGSCCNGGWDGFEVGLSSNKGNAKSGVQNAASSSASQDWSGLVN